MNKKQKSILLLSIFTISLLFLFNLNNSLALQDNDDLETTIHSYFETNSAEVSSSLMGLGTYDFFDAPELDDGTFNHDLTKIDVGRVQLVEFNSTSYQSYMVREGVDDGVGNHTFEFTQNLPEYEISKELDTQISVIMNYSALDYDNMETFTDDMEKADYILENDDSEEIEIVEVSEHFGNESFTFETIGDSGASEIEFINSDNKGCTSIIPDIDGHEMVLKLDKQATDIREYITHDFDTPQTSDTVEYWVRPEQLTEPARILFVGLYGVGSGEINFLMTGEFFSYYDGSTYKESVSYSINKWYRIRLDFNVASTWGFYIYDSDGTTLLDSETGLTYWNGAITSISRFRMDLQSHWMDPQPDVTAYIDGFGKVSDPDYNLGDNIYPNESIYCSDDQITELTLTSDVYFEEQQLDDGDDLLVGLKTNTTKSVDLQLLKEGVLVKEFEILATGNLIHEDQIINISITERLIFDQIKLVFILDEKDWIQFYFVKGYGYTNDLIFSHAYIEDFEYQILGANYTDTLELARDTYNSDNKAENGTHVYYFSSSDLSNFDHSNNLIILDQWLNVTYHYANDLNMNLNFSLKVNYSSNSWKLPSQVNLKINDEDVSDLTLNSGVVYLSSYPESLKIEGDSEVLFELNFTVTFSFKLNLEVISRTYLKKSFKLLSDHSIYIESLDLPDSLEIKKIYLNSNDLGSDNPNVLSPPMEMGIGYIFSLEVILSDDIYLPLNYVDGGEYDTIYSELFGYETSEMNNSFYPDDNNSTCNVDGTLNMNNEFPNEFHSEDWNDWMSINDSLYTETSFENGNFSSELNTYNSSGIPNQPTDFIFHNGTFNNTNYGDLNYLDGNYTILNSTNPSSGGTYPAEYTFTDDTVGNDPAGWSITEAGGTINIVSDWQGHDKVLDLHKTGSGWTKGYSQFTDKKSGTVEWWMGKSSTSVGTCTFAILDGIGNVGIQITFGSTGYITYYDSSSHNIQTYSTDTWYHFLVTFNCDENHWHLWINGVSKDGGSGYLYRDNPVNMDTVMFHSYEGTYPCHNYLDAVDYSWSSGYYTNRNYEALPGEDAILNFTVETQLNTSMVHSNETIDWVNLKYSYNTSTSFQGVNFSIWNFNTNQYDIVNNSEINDNFYEWNYKLNLNQYNSTYHVILKFDGINSTSEFQLYLDELKIEFNWTKTSGNIYSYFQKDILYSFMNLYDSFVNYQKLYNISVNFRYIFTNYTSYNHSANFTIESIEYNLIIDNSWHDFNIDFNFNSNSRSNFTNLFNITNGLLQISEMNYTITFICLDIYNKTRLYQYYKLDPVFNLNYYEKTEGEMYLNFTFDLTGRYTIKYDYYYPIADALFLIIANVQTEDSWINFSYEYNLTRSKIISLNILELINNNSKSEFRDFTLEIYMVGDVSVEIDDLYLYKKLQKIQVDKSPRTDSNSVNFIDYLTASRSFSYWYFQNNIEINSVDLTNLRTSETIETFEINNSRYYFQESIQSNDILSSNLDYNPNWDITFEIVENNGVYSKIKVSYYADLVVRNVTIILDLSSECYNDNWTLNAEQNSNTLKLEIPAVNFSTIEKSFYIEGYSDTPNAMISSYESDQNWNQIAEDTEITFAGFIEYPKYTNTFLLNVENDWMCYDIYYGNKSYSTKKLSNTQIYVVGTGFDKSVNNSYLHFTTKPFKTADWNYENDIITITIESSLPVEKTFFKYGFNPSGVHDLEIIESNIEIDDLSDSETRDYLTFNCDLIPKGKTIIKIHVNFATPLEVFIQMLFPLLTFAAFIGIYYYFKNNEAAAEKIQKFVSEKIIDKIEKKLKKGDGYEELRLYTDETNKVHFKKKEEVKD